MSLLYKMVTFEDPASGSKSEKSELWQPCHADQVRHVAVTNMGMEISILGMDPKENPPGYLGCWRSRKSSTGTKCWCWNAHLADLTVHCRWKRTHHQVCWCSGLIGQWPCSSSQCGEWEGEICSANHKQELLHALPKLIQFIPWKLSSFQPQCLSLLEFWSEDALWNPYNQEERAAQVRWKMEEVPVEPWFQTARWAYPWALWRFWRKMIPDSEPQQTLTRDFLMPKDVGHVDWWDWRYLRNLWWLMPVRDGNYDNT